MTKVSCANQNERGVSIRDIKVFTLYHITTRANRKVHTGFFGIDKDEFIILCGAHDNILGYNNKSSYDLNTIEKVKGPLIVTFN